MRRSCVVLAFCLVLAFGIMLTSATHFALAQDAAATGPYQILKTVKVGGEGGFDYVFADTVGRRLYVPRSGPAARISVYDLDTFELKGELPGINGHGAIVDPKTNHGFVTSKPVAMFDAKTLAIMKTIEVEGSPDGIMFDAFNQRVYDLSHTAPTATVIDTKDGSILGTIDLGGAPEQAVSDGKGTIYVDVEDKDKIAVVNASTMAVTKTFDVAGKGGTCAGLAMDIKNHILFATCRNPRNMVIVNADEGNVITTLPIGAASDGAIFNPATMEAFSSNSDGTLTVVKENSPTSFVVEQNMTTMPSAKTMTFDNKTGHILMIAATFEPAPAGMTLGNGRIPRGPMVPGSFSILVIGKP